MAYKASQIFPGLSINLGAYASSGSATVTSTNLLAWSFIAPKNPFGVGSLGVSAIRFNIATVTGSPKCTCSIYSDNAGVPNAAIANGAGVETGVLTTGWKEATWAGTLPVLTEGTQYWVVFKCSSGTSFVVNYNINSGRIVNCQGVVGSTQSGVGISWRNTVAQGLDGAFGGTGSPGVTGFRLKLTDGTDYSYIGYPAYAASSFPSAGYKADGTNEIGVKITTPKNVKLSLKSIACLLGQTGAPGDLVMKAYLGSATSPFATSNVVPVANINDADQTAYLFDFSSPMTLEANTLYRFTLSAATGDASNFFYSYGISYDNDAESLALLHMGCIFTYLSSGSWTDYDVIAGCIAFVLDSTNTDGPFTSTGGAGGGAAKLGFGLGMG